MSSEHQVAFPSRDMAPEVAAFPDPFASPFDAAQSSVEKTRCAILSLGRSILRALNPDADRFSTYSSWAARLVQSRGRPPLRQRVATEETSRIHAFVYLSQIWQMIGKAHISLVIKWLIAYAPEIQGEQGLARRKANVLLTEAVRPRLLPLAPHGSNWPSLIERRHKYSVLSMAMHAYMRKRATRLRAPLPCRCRWRTGASMSPIRPSVCTDSSFGPSSATLRRSVEKA